MSTDLPLENKKPTNLLLITVDQHRYDYLGFLGKVAVSTPNLDRLASHGAFHPHAYTVNPLCMPARCSLLTGLYSHQHGMNNNQGDLNPSLHTLPQALKTLGYQTAMIGKIHFYEGVPDRLDYVSCKKEINALGFDYSWITAGKQMPAFCTDDWTEHLKEQGLLDQYCEDLTFRGEVSDGDSTFLKEEDTVDYLTAEKAMEYLESYDSSDPFYMWLSFCNPHPHFDPLDEILQDYKSRDFRDPVNCKEDLEIHRKNTKAYAALIEQVDAYVGKVLKSLEESGLVENTLILFTADHGEMLGDHNKTGKAFYYDPSARVPFIASHKNLIQPGSYNQAVEITDIAATFLAVAGESDLQKHLPESPSQSLLNVWQGGSLKRRYAFFESGYQFYAPFQAICDGEWKYAFYSFTGEEALHHLPEDPHELNNLVEAMPEKTAQMRHTLLKRLGATPSPKPPPWIHEKLTGSPGAVTSHGPGLANTGLMNLE